MVDGQEFPYLLIDHNFRCISDVSSVDVSAKTCIFKLKDMIKEKHPSTLDGLDASKFVVWRSINVKLPSSGSERGDFEDHVGSMTFSRENIQELHSSRLVMSYNVPVDEVLLIQVPEIASNPGNITDGHVRTVLIKKYSSTFIKVHNWGRFEESDISLNNVAEAQRVPDFVAVFGQNLERKQGLDPNLRAWSETCIGNAQTWAQYFEEMIAEDGSSPEMSCDAQELEVLHITHIARHKWERFWTGAAKRLKEHLSNSLFFDILHLIPKDRTIDVHTNKPLPFHLVTECVATDLPAEEQLRKYYPRNDFIILQSSLPRLLVEVNSTSSGPWPPDLIRMLLQGAAIVRFVNTLQVFRQAKNFVLCGIFIWDGGSATRYDLFQDDNEVYYEKKEFTLNDPVDRVIFTQQLYNLLDPHEMIGKDQDKKARDEMRALDTMILQKGMKSFHTATPKLDKMTGNDGRQESSADDAELRAHGYELKWDDADNDEWQPFFKWPSHILTVFRPSRPSKALIAKKVCKRSNEVEILKLINATKLKSDHVIMLVDSFHGQSTNWVILPKMSSIASYLDFAPDQLQNKVTEVCRGLIKGLGFLHHLNIAHRDIKPSNLIVDKFFCLKIIDFDIAIVLEDKDEEVDEQCGTKGWIAPEVEKKMKHSPIKADQWSCGYVILYLLGEFRIDHRLLRANARRLKDHNPDQRPALLDLPYSLLSTSVVSKPTRLRIEDDGEIM